jgi:hypothetical protein
MQKRAFWNEYTKDHFSKLLFINNGISFCIFLISLKYMEAIASPFDMYCVLLLYLFV